MTPYKRAQLPDRFDAIVIGSGMGGLTVAMLLATQAGKRVLVLERHYEAGGFTHTFRRPGYEWDVGLHYVGQMHAGSPVRRAFDHVTRDAVEWQPMPQTYDRVRIAGKSYDFVAGPENFRERLHGWFPRELRAIDGYLAAVRACNRASGLYYAEKVVPRFVSKLAGGLMRMSYMRWAGRTTADVLRDLKASPELAGVLTAQWGDYGLPPARSSFAIHATVAEHYFAGASYPIGGAGVIAKAIAPAIEDSGGFVVTSAEVASILVRSDAVTGVKMADGREFTAPVVISDAGAANTFECLLSAEIPALDSLRAKLCALEPSTAHLSLYMGVSPTDAELTTDPANLWIYPSYDHDRNVAAFAKDLNAEFPVVYISFPSARDPDFARRYPGHGTVEAITMLPYDRFAQWEQARWKRRGEDYDNLKRGLAARLQTEVEKQVPALAGNIAYAELSTPVTTRHFMNYAHGEIYGIAATPARYLLRELGAFTPIKGLYLTGQDVSSLGIVGALFGGAITASAIAGRNLISTITKA